MGQFGRNHYRRDQRPARRELDYAALSAGSLLEAYCDEPSKMAFLTLYIALFEEIRSSKFLIPTLVEPSPAHPALVSAEILILPWTWAVPSKDGTPYVDTSHSNGRYHEAVR